MDIGLKYTQDLFLLNVYCINKYGIVHHCLNVVSCCILYSFVNTVFLIVYSCILPCILYDCLTKCLVFYITWYCHNVVFFRAVYIYSVLLLHPISLFFIVVSCILPCILYDCLTLYSISLGTVLVQYSLELSIYSVLFFMYVVFSK